MADLDEGPLQFPEGIYQLENGDPVDGGTPNLAAKTGMDNVPHLMLAQRTAWLKEEVAALAEALGGEAILDRLKPVDGPGSGLDADYLDGKQGAAYALYSGTVKAQAFRAEVNGYQMLPNGILIQWGRATGIDDGDAVFYPISFVDACYSVVLTDANNGGGPGAADVIGPIGNPGRAGFTVRIYNIDGTAQTSREFFYLAIGR